MRKIAVIVIGVAFMLTGCATSEQTSSTVTSVPNQSSYIAPSAPSGSISNGSQVPASGGITSQASTASQKQPPASSRSTPANASPNGAGSKPAAPAQAPVTPSSKVVAPSQAPSAPAPSQEPLQTQQPEPEVQPEPEPSSAAPVDAGSIAAPGGSQFLGNTAKDVFALVNEERQAQGLSPLQWDSTCLAAAKARAAEMMQNQYLEHQRPNGSGWETIFAELNIGNLLYAAEWYKNYETDAQTMFDGWKNSPGHYANMTSDRYTHTAIAICYDGVQWYAVQLFMTYQ